MTVDINAITRRWEAANRSSHRDPELAFRARVGEALADIPVMVTEIARLRDALSAAPPPDEWTAEEYDAWWDNTRHPALHNL